MNFLRMLWAKYQTRRAFCRHCMDVAVEPPARFCSDECVELAEMEYRAA